MYMKIYRTIFRAVPFLAEKYWELNFGYFVNYPIHTYTSYYICIYTAEIPERVLTTYSVTSG